MNTKKTIGYKKVKKCDCFSHLDKKCCKLNTGTIKETKVAFYEPWNFVDHITNFRIRPKNDQEHLLLNKNKISNEDMTQFYVEQKIFDNDFL